jgi:4-hydroxybutyrate CoA-transferase
MPEEYASKLTSLPLLINEIPDGASLYVHSNAAAPLAILRELCASSKRDITATHLLALGDIPYLAQDYTGCVRHRTWFVGANARRAVAAGRADYIPVFLGEIHRLIAAGPPFDVALLQVSPPDAHGYCSLGVDVTLCHAAIANSRKVLAQVNPQMPRTHGESFVHLKHIDKLVEVDQALPELPVAQPTAVHAAIGRHIADLIGDGDCLQMGIGAIPDAVLDALRDRRDLGLHTEMFSNMAVELMQLGVINGERKRLNKGKAVTSFVLGCRATYEFLHDNPLVEMRPVDYTNDPFTIARNDNMVAINGCLQIDLTGQVVSDNMGRQIVSGFGGQVDFIRGAARSSGGRPIIATPSTAKGGSLSRIVAEHPAGYGITTTRADVHWVATEYGLVNLFGLSRSERAKTLIELAHPDFRTGLTEEAGQMGLL